MVAAPHGSWSLEPKWLRDPCGAATMFRTGLRSSEKIMFRNIAREWRMKYAEGGLTGGAVAVDKLFKEKFLADVNASTQHSVTVTRMVCGGCNDYKLIMSLPAEEFKKWDAKGFAPEKEFVEAVKAVPGITQVEQQTLTYETL